ncbi:MFS transporter [Microbispora bryophytorum]|uniref:Multidrug efflux pump Tap n=1 Tax=Microbispora bryophytorum TaxID=1460882 RepID=A0A8H9GYP9_9ACTN|nr:MFS transporter [Microbispora bryophytorum]MBD3134693.1 MFS transporter [Microbispora bryophytorum]TQS09026.1 MFS transporter [Microbispora bryophytorum]GGO12774.1 MFS transporter [Microbispora bryophytorum]
MSATTARPPRSSACSSRPASAWAFTVDCRPLAIPAFRRMWAASVICAVGGSFSVVAVPTQLFTVTGSSAAVGAAAGVSFAALVAAAVWSGALADRMDRRTMLLAAHLGLALTYAALWLQAVLGGRSVPVLLVAVAFQGLTYGTVLTTTGATVPRLVPAGLLPAANSLSSLVRYGGSVLGPMLAGVLVPVVGLGTLYLFDAVALLAVVGAVAMLPPLPPLPPPTTGTGTGTGTEESAVGTEGGGRGTSAARRTLAGFRYLAADRLLVAVLAVDLAAMIFGMPSALFPELARHVFGGTAGGGTQTGLLYAAYPAGVFAAGLLSGAFTRARRHGALVAVAAVAWGITVVLVGLAPELWIALAALMLGGAVNFVLSTFRTTIVQAHTGDAVRGRVQGALTVVLVGGPQIANVLHGSAGAALQGVTGPLHDAASALSGPRIVICAGGLLTVVTVTAIAWAIPDLRRYIAPAPAPALTRAPAPAPAPVLGPVAGPASPVVPADRVSPASASRARAGRG